MRKKNTFKRRANRKRVKETYAAEMEWHQHIIGFHIELFSTDWDNVKEDYNIFQKWNDEWQKHCSKVNKKYKSIAADSRAFYDYAISQNVKG